MYPSEGYSTTLGQITAPTALHVEMLQRARRRGWPRAPCTSEGGGGILKASSGMLSVEHPLPIRQVLQNCNSVWGSLDLDPGILILITVLGSTVPKVRRRFRHVEN